MPATENSTNRSDVPKLLGQGTFRFACHSGVACFTRCCHDADMYLYPYDIVRLKQRLEMTFMASYNVDTFRRFVFDSSFLSRYEVPRERLDAIAQSDTELLLLGFDWIQRFLFNQGALRDRQRVAPSSP